jgi:hypothetical protein
VADPVPALTLDLLEWLAPGPRPYAEVIGAWRTSCPRLPVWEDATDRGYLELGTGEDGVLVVRLTPGGREFLSRHRGVDRAPGSRVAR